LSGKTGFPLFLIALWTSGAQIKSQIQDIAVFASIAPIQSASVSRISFMTSPSFRPERTSTWKE
jgi:hypothetical protein